MKFNRTACIALALGILLCCGTMPVQGQPKLPNPFGGKPKPPKEGEPIPADKNSEEFYLDMKDFAEGLYNKQIGTGDNRIESDFKHNVDTRYEALKRSDADRAYHVNSSAHSEVKYVIEDRFRVFSGLYDNLLVQDLLNRTGQSIIPATSGHLYAFKLIADPVPSAVTLSTGTIYVSTGLVALLSNKAQLAYVLAHEAAHVYHNDYKTEIMLDLAYEEYAKERGANKEEVAKKLSTLLGIGGMAFGGLAGGGKGAGIGLAVGAVAGAIVAQAAERAPVAVKDWNRIQEDEADKAAFEWVRNAKLDVQEIPKVYQALKDAGDRDDRVTLGFLGRSNRVRERAKRIEELITLEKGKAEFAKGAIVTDPDFDILLAEVKRDNGILAFQYDMLDLAKDNLEKAVAIKTSDPSALYFYAKILKETAKNDDERAKANEYFRRAAANDHRKLNFGAELHRAVAMLTPDATVAEKKEAVSLLRQYVEDYFLTSVQDRQAQSYPPHLETIYDYMSRLGEFDYVLDGKKVLQQREQAQKLVQTSGPGVDVNAPPAPPATTGQTPPKTPAPKPAAAKPVAKPVSNN
jgi:predicted Zn-dependent protease